MVVSWVADNWARSSTSLGRQYAGLSLYVVAEAVIFLPMLYIAERMSPHVIPEAGLITLLLFGGLTGVVAVTKADFSFLRMGLSIGGFAALGVIVCSMIFGFNLGILFTAAMLVLASGYILYHTSNVLHVYRTDQYVAAALALFASVALLFWYVLRLLMEMNRR
jgi:FtsH-binding integral membrane protein